MAWRRDATSNAVRWFLEILDELAEAAELKLTVNGGRSPAIMPV